MTKFCANSRRDELSTLFEGIDNETYCSGVTFVPVHVSFFHRVDIDKYISILVNNDDRIYVKRSWAFCTPPLPETH